MDEQIYWELTYKITCEYSDNQFYCCSIKDD